MYEDYNNKSYSITAEQSKDVELRQEKEFIVYYLRKALIMVGDMKISEAIAQLEKELEPKLEPNILNLKLESKTVKCEELQGYDYLREEDGTEVVKKIDNDESFSKTMERYAKFAANDPEFFEYFLKLQRFHYEHCEHCGTQRCLGVYDKDWREGCKLYKEEFVSDMDTKLETNQKNEHNIAKCEYCLTVFEYNYSELEEEEDRDMRGYHYYYYAKCPKCGNRILVKSLI